MEANSSQAIALLTTNHAPSSFTPVFRWEPQKGFPLGPVIVYINKCQVKDEISVK